MLYSNLRLERPSTALAASFVTMRDGCLAGNDDQWTGPHALAHTDPIAYAAMLRDWAAGKNVPEGWVPADTFWIVEGEEVVGECDVRHWLTPQLREIGGHIGYIVHPAYRNREHRNIRSRRMSQSPRCTRRDRGATNLRRVERGLCPGHRGEVRWTPHL